MEMVHSSTIEHVSFAVEPTALSVEPTVHRIIPEPITIVSGSIVAALVQAETSAVISADVENIETVIVADARENAVVAEATEEAAVVTEEDAGGNAKTVVEADNSTTLSTSCSITPEAPLLPVKIGRLSTRDAQPNTIVKKTRAQRFQAALEAGTHVGRVEGSDSFTTFRPDTGFVASDRGSVVNRIRDDIRRLKDYEEDGSNDEPRPTLSASTVKSAIKHITTGWPGWLKYPDENPASPFISTSANFVFLIWEVARQLAKRNVPEAHISFIKLDADLFYFDATEAINDYAASLGAEVSLSDMAQKAQLWARTPREVLVLDSIPSKLVSRRRWTRSEMGFALPPEFFAPMSKWPVSFLGSSWIDRLVWDPSSGLSCSVAMRNVAQRAKELRPKISTDELSAILAEMNL